MSDLLMERIMSRTDKDIPTWVKRCRGAETGQGTMHNPLLIGRWISTGSFYWHVTSIPGTSGRYADYCTCNRITEFTPYKGRWVLNPDAPVAEHIYAPCVPLWIYPSEDAWAYRGRRMRPVADRAGTRDYLHKTLGQVRRGDTTNITELQLSDTVCLFIGQGKV